MSIRFRLRHRTWYRYDRLVALGPHVLRLHPAPHARAAVSGFALSVAPARHVLRWMHDPQGNRVARVVFEERMDRLEVEASLVLDLSPFDPFDFLLEPWAERFPLAAPADPELERELSPCRHVAPGGPLLEAFMASVDMSPAPTVEVLAGLNRRLARDIRYVARLEPGIREPEETLARGEGSCRDTSWLLAQVLRRLGFATRFVSGYLVQPAAASAAARDEAALHAWCEAWLPGAGAAPVSGTLEPAASAFGFEVEVERLDDPAARHGSGPPGR